MEITTSLRLVSIGCLLSPSRLANSVAHIAVAASTQLTLAGASVSVIACSHGRCHLAGVPAVAVPCDVLPLEEAARRRPCGRVH
eukprot:6173498-Pleurochrysis_carterae.AAC.1